MGVLQLLGPDESTVLWDFADPSGAANPSTVTTKLMRGIDLGTIGQDLSVFRTAIPGGRLMGVTQGPMEARIDFQAAASTYANLLAGLGTLARRLSEARPESPVVLKWTEGGTFYLDVIGVHDLPALLRGQPSAGIVAGRSASVTAIPLTFLIQPWKRGARVDVAGVTVPNDPATSTKARVYPVTATGDLRTPARVRVQFDSGSTVERTLIANRAQGNRAAAVMADYLSDTAFFQCEATGRGWTITLGTDTTATTDANASPGSSNTIAQCTYATAATMTRRVHATRTTKVDSLRGSWDAYLRCKATAAAKHVVQGRWGLSATDLTVFNMDEVTHDTSVNGTPGSFGYVELFLGTINIPEDVTVAVGGLTFDVYTRRDSGTGNLNMDLVHFVPHEPQGTVAVPPGSSVKVLGADLVTPVTNPGGGTAGVVSGSRLTLNDTTDNAGVQPAGGEVWPAGVHRLTFRIEMLKTAVVDVLVRNITSSSTPAGFSRTFTANGHNTIQTYAIVLQVTADGTSAYQAQVDNPTVAGDAVQVLSITRTFVPSLLVNESIRTDPTERYSVDRLDTSGNLSGYLGVEGELMAWLEPGLNHLVFRFDEIPIPLYEENENKLARTPTVSVAYWPRYAL